MASKNWQCVHGRDGYYCKECGGDGICPHSRQRHRCKECHGSCVCEHGRTRSYCSLCKPLGGYNMYKIAARKRGYGFDISPTDFEKIITRSCWYCGRSPELAGGMGVDRFDNALGYDANNCVPCCFVCNRMKYIHGITFFLEHIQRIAKNRRVSIS